MLRSFQPKVSKALPLRAGFFFSTAETNYINPEIQQAILLNAKLTAFSSIEEVDLNTTLHEMGYDSLETMIFLTRCEFETGVTLPEESILKDYVFLRQVVEEFSRLHKLQKPGTQ